VVQASGPRVFIQVGTTLGIITMYIQKNLIYAKSILGVASHVTRV
jgi:hypothetical protein